MDVQLPDVDGVCALGRLRADPSAPHPGRGLHRLRDAGGPRAAHGRRFRWLLEKPIEVRTLLEGEAIAPPPPLQPKVLVVDDAQANFEC